ncbi:MAG: tetratricopeptide repeat protein [Candidatus Riflebacteria bacterium]|nr:tetratricopeptide repeat protein [Candidatus Riflebacteria bacterium]
MSGSTRHRAGRPAARSSSPFTAGREALDRRDYPAAIHHYTAALAREPSPEARNNLAIALFRSGRLDEACSQLREVVRLKPEATEPRYNLGLVLKELGRTVEALECFLAALERDPDHAESLFQVGAHHLAAGRYDEALAALGRVEQAWPPAGSPGVSKAARASLLANLGAAALGAGRPEEALEWLKRALELAPDDPRLHLNAGLALERLGKRDEVVGHYRAVPRLAPDWVEGALRLATFFAQERPRDPAHRQEAIETLREVLELPVSEDEVKRRQLARAWFLLGSLYDDLPDRYPDAIEAYRKGLALEPGFSTAHNNLGALYLQSGNDQQALEHLEQALLAAPNSRNVHRNLAKLLYHRQTVEQGARLFCRIAEQGGASAGVGLFGLAQALVDQASVEAYEDLYSRGHQVKNRVGMAASRLKRLARAVRSGELAGEPLARKLDEALADQEDLYALLVAILRVVRPESLKPVEVDVGEALHRLVARLRTVHKGRARIKLQVQPGMPLVRVDKARTAEVINNLVGNAVEALSERYGDDAARKGLVIVTAASLPASREVLVSVEDNGPGIHPTSIQEVFRPGFTTKPAGSGLGLAISRRIVADHGGVLEVEGRWGQGARFTARIPMDLEAKSAPTGLWSRPLVVAEPEALLVDELA